MCKGNNKDVIDVLRGVPGTQTFGVEISFPIIIGALNDDSLKKSLSDLRGALVDLLKGSILTRDTIIKLGTWGHEEMERWLYQLYFSWKFNYSISLFCLMKKKKKREWL